MDGVDWRELYHACRRDALARGVSEVDADDVAQEAVTRALEGEADQVVTYARLTARRLAGQMASGYSSRRSSGRGLVGPMPRPLSYPATEEDDSRAHERGVLASFQLLEHGLARASECHEAAIDARRELEALTRGVARDVLARCTSMGGGGAGRQARRRARARARDALDPPRL